ncbi:MAG: MBL fold metallo-hydrolase [Lachnospiraceae bacterium]|nr:MBL fold metallo-hydrolase [Lachnospiraceae bacterium]
METKLTVIVDNTPYNGMSGEWGLCILAQHGNNNILVDTGSSALFLENMKKLGLAVEDVDYAVLSHAHYDHGNGMPYFFSENHKARFYLQEAAAPNCYAKKFIFRKYIGIPKNVIKDHSDRIEYVSGDYKLCEGAYLISHKTPGLDMIGRRELMYVRSGHRYRPDDFAHEQSLVLDTDKGLVIINSCSHAGVINIINEVRTAFDDRHIYGYIGGMHLFNKSEEEIRSVARSIGESGLDYICTGHCTKERAFAVMKEELGDKIEQFHVGMTISAT